MMSSSRSLTVLTASDVDQILATLDLQSAIQSQADVFDAFSATTARSRAISRSPASPGISNIQNPHRSTIETEKSTSLFMPARVADLGTTTCKIVSVSKASASSNREGGAESAGEGAEARGLPAVTVVLDDEGYVRGMVNARRLTAMRNACGSALFLQRCEPRNPPRSCVIFGSGEQAYAHASVLMRVYETIQRCTFVIRRETARARALMKWLKEEHVDAEVDSLISTYGSSEPRFAAGQNLTTSAASPSETSLRNALQSADVIITATSSQVALFPSEYVKHGARIILIGSYKPHMREVEDNLIKKAAKVVVDSKEACFQEAGELISAGLKEEDVVELGQFRPDMRDEGDTNGAEDVSMASRGDGIVVFKSVGLGVQDVAIAKLVLDDAERRRIGTRVDAFD